MNLDLVGRPVPWPPSARRGLRALPAVPGSCPLSSSPRNMWFSMSVQTNLDSEVALFPGSLGPSNWVRDPRRFYQAAAHELATPSVVTCPADPRALLEATGGVSMVPPGPLSVPWEKSSYFVDWPDEMHRRISNVSTPPRSMSACLIHVRLRFVLFNRTV